MLRVHFHARTNDGGPNEAGERTLAELRDLTRGHDHVIVCLDSPPYARNKVYPEYKAGRPRDESYIHICRWTKERLVADGFSIAAFTGAEADDVIATLAWRISAMGPEVRIVGADKDALQCVFDGDDLRGPVRVLAPVTGGSLEVRDEAWVKKRYGVTPAQWPLALAIMGDKGDNIPGIAGIGEKGAAKLINEFGSFEAMRKASSKALADSLVPGAKPLAAFWKKFLEGAERLPEWLRLVTLDRDLLLDVPALLTKQAPLPLVDDDSSWGEADSPTPEELQTERDIMTGMLDAAEVISKPKGPAPVPIAPSDPDPRSLPDWNCDHCPEHQRNAGWAIECGRCGAKREAKPEPPKEASRESPASGAPSGNGHMRETAPTDAAGSAQAGRGSSPRKGEDIDPPSELVVHGEGRDWNLALQPRTANEALQIAKVLFNSRLCSQFGSERGAYAIISLGREYGLGMMQSLMAFHNVKDRPFAGWQVLLALAESDPNCEWIMCTESELDRATWETKHRKHPRSESFTFTREEATRNGCYTGGNKHNWQTRERQMMRKTALANAVKIWYPARTMGLLIPEELNDE